MLFARYMHSLIRKGELTIIDAGGKIHRSGDARRGPSVTLRLHDRSLHAKLVLNTKLAFGEAYMDGRLTLEKGSIYDCLALYGMNRGVARPSRLERWVNRLRMFWLRHRKTNKRGVAGKNVAHHYDLSGALYDLFLDADRQYSCAYFPRPDATLETAQFAKKQHIAAKLLLEPGQRVLDIGSGWGGLALHLAETSGAEVTGVTLSAEQLQVARRRAGETGLSGRVNFMLRDYRDETGPYDRVVSVGMFEHVGLAHYGEFFTKIGELLSDSGVALLHTIGFVAEPRPTNPWVKKYIFPGGYTPSLSEVVSAIEGAGLWVTDIEILRLHYAETLRHWRRRFAANRDKVAKLYDERFCRMWEFYLAGSEVGFRYDGLVVFQIQIAKNRHAVPLTRDYMVDWERARGIGNARAAE